MTITSVSHSSVLKRHCIDTIKQSLLMPKRFKKYKTVIVQTTFGIKMNT